MESMSTPPNKPRYEHSERLSDRKRALFPSMQDSDDSDLGHISPLRNNSSPERLQNILNKNDTIESRYFIGFDKSSLRTSCFSPGLEFIEDSEDSNDNSMVDGRFLPNIVKANQENISPASSIHLTLDSPHITTSSPSGITEITSVLDTPIKSPTEILKTPHDASNNTNLELPRIVRKSLLDITNFDATGLKRKIDSPIETSANKTMKFDHSSKTSKARTALFTENIFPAKSFYPKSDTNKHDISFRNDSFPKMKNISRKPAPVYLCNRGKGKSKKNYFGQINAGVRHKIKKPKHKPALTKVQLLKAAVHIVKNSPLNEYLDSIETKSVSSENECGVSFEQIQKMDSILKNIDTKTLQAEPLLAQQKNVSSDEDDTAFDLNKSKKRPLSPQVDNKKKFFKSSHSKATITISNNIKLKYDHGECSLIEKQNKFRKPKHDNNVLEFSFNDDNNKMIDNSFSEIIKSLEDDNILDKSTDNNNSMVLTAHNSITASENSIQLHQNIPKITNSMLLSPTSLVCDLTSGLILDSPKNQPQIPATVDKLSNLKKRISFPENMDNQKLFPIFYGKQNDPKPVKENKYVKNIRKIWKPLSEDQTLIDAGQKRFGLTQCSECKCVYSLGEPEDEIMHYNHHNSIGILRYNGWKNERIVNHFSNGKVIQINPNDSKNWWKKVKELMEVINRELGFVDVPFDIVNKKVFLCIINKQIVGCLVSEPKSQAHKMLSTTIGVDQCSEETYPVKCGISRLWVAVTHRKKGIATCLMNAMRSNFMYGHILSTHDIAFSAPTEAGKKFAAKYTKTDEFFIYTS